MIYFDNAATTQVDPTVLTTYTEVATKIWGNPSSLHRLGSQASRILEASRSQIADLLGKKSDEIFFTSGGTEGDNWVIKGVALERAHLGKHVIVSAVEHPAVRESALWLTSLGFEVSVAPVDAAGRLQVEALRSLLRPDTTVVSIMAVNNEMGAIQPIAAISELLSAYPTVSFHVDAVQAIGKLPLTDFLTDRVDFATFSGHKFHAVRGVGFVYAKAGKKIAPLLVGGGQERDKRSTTENVAGIAAMAKALRLTLEQAEKESERLAAMKTTLFDSLSQYPDVTLFSERDGGVPTILTFGVKQIRGEVLVHAFEDHDIYISTTSACSSKAGKPAGTLIAMGVPVPVAQTAVRISLDPENTLEEITQFLTIFKKIYHNTQKVR